VYTPPSRMLLAHASPPHLLVSALDGALTLPEVHHLALTITKDLDLNVVSLLNELLNKHLVGQNNTQGSGANRTHDSHGATTMTLHKTQLLLLQET